MTDREALSAAIDRFTTNWASGDFQLIAVAARERLAQLPEICGTCLGEHRVPTIDQYTERCPTCRGVGEAYPAETVEQIARAVTRTWVNDGTGLAIVVLDALNGESV